MWEKVYLVTQYTQRVLRGKVWLSRFFSPCWQQRGGLGPWTISLLLWVLFPFKRQRLKNRELPDERQSLSRVLAQWGLIFPSMWHGLCNCLPFTWQHAVGAGGSEDITGWWRGEMSGLRKRMKKRPDGGAPASPKMLALSTERGFTAQSYKTQGGGRSTRERTPAD